MLDIHVFIQTQCYWYLHIHAESANHVPTPHNTPQVILAQVLGTPCRRESVRAL